MNTSVFFSVIIPTLNEAVYLPRLLESLEAQEYRNFEVIVVDGNSDDGTVDKAAIFRQRLPKLIIASLKKGNVSMQRNVGVKKAQGKYLTFFDADVVVEANFLKQLKQQIETRRLLLCTTNIIPDVPSRFKKILTSISNVGRDFFLIFGHAYVGGYNITIEKSFFDKLGGFNERITYSEDIDLLARAKQQGVLIKNLHTPVLGFCFRRFDQLGYWHIAKIYGKSMFLELMGVKSAKLKVDYPMNGKIYKEQTKL